MSSNSNNSSNNNNSNNRTHELGSDDNRRRATPPPRPNNQDGSFISSITRLITDLNPSNIEQIPSNDSDVLFSGVLGNQIPPFAITIDRTNILPNGRPQTTAAQGGLQDINNPGLVFNLGNIPDALRDLVERSMQIPGTSAVRATEDAIKHLKSLDPDDLPEDSKKCSICYEEFDHPTYDNKKTVNVQERFEEINTDPPVPMLVGPTTQTYSLYSKFPRPSSSSAAAAAAQQESTSESSQSEHIPVQMPCKHIFGRSCLVEWLKQNVSCPLCRQEVEAEQNSTTAARSLIINRTNVPSNLSSQSDNLMDDPPIPIPVNSSNSNRFRNQPILGGQGLGGFLGSLINHGAGTITGAVEVIALNGNPATNNNRDNNGSGVAASNEGTPSDLPRS